MPEALGSLGSIFGSVAPVLTGATAGAGLVGNILNSITRSNQVGQLQSAEKRFANLTPEQFSSLVTRSEQPLSQNLLESVGNQVQADVASRGLAESPGVFATTESQALAPYEIQEQQMAMQRILTQLGLPIEYANSIIQSLGPSANVAGLLSLLMKGGASPTPQGIDPSIINLIRSTVMPGQDTTSSDVGGTLIPPPDTTDLSSLAGGWT